MEPLSPGELESQLRAIGAAKYHDKHPFHKLMNDGKLTKEQLQVWVVNRLYYQINIPVKDALILAKCPDRQVRQAWVRRIIDHDGTATEPGGIEKWIRLGEAMGFSMPRFLLSGDNTIYFDTETGRLVQSDIESAD